MEDSDSKNRSLTGKEEIQKRRVWLVWLCPLSGTLRFATTARPRPSSWSAPSWIWGTRRRQLRSWKKRSWLRSPTLRAWLWPRRSVRVWPKGAAFWWEDPRMKEGNLALLLGKKVQMSYCALQKFPSCLRLQQFLCCVSLVLFLQCVTLFLARFVQMQWNTWSARPWPSADWRLCSTKPFGRYFALSPPRSRKSRAYCCEWWESC